MKKSEINSVLEGIRPFRMPKITDKAFRNKLIGAHLRLLAEQRKYRQAVDDLREAHLSAFPEERKRVDELNDKLAGTVDAKERAAVFAELNGMTEFNAAARAFSEDAKKLGDEEVAVEPLDRAGLIAAIEEQDLGFDAVERLFPLFKD